MLLFRFMGSFFILRFLARELRAGDGRAHFLFRAELIPRLLLICVKEQQSFTKVPNPRLMFVLHLSGSIGMFNQWKDAVGETPTAATETVALPKP